MIFICLGNASNLTRNVAFQTAQQLTDELFTTCTATQQDRHMVFIPLNLLGIFLRLTLELSLVVHCKKVLFCPNKKCPSRYIRWWFVSHFLATSLLNQGLMKHLLNSLNAVLRYVSLKYRSCPFECLKLMPTFRPISSVFDVKVCPSTARQFCQTLQNYSNSSSSILLCFVP